MSNRIDILPVIHGSCDFTRIVRKKLLEEPCDCLAVCLPIEFQVPLEEGIRHLPFISLVASEEPNGSFNYVPVDPSQPVIMGIRIAKQEGIPRAFIDWSTSNYQVRQHIFPDSFALSRLSYEKFSVSILTSIPKLKINSLYDFRVRWMAYQLHLLEMDYRNIVFICSFLDWPWIKNAFDNKFNYQNPSKTTAPDLYGLKENNLFFALSEIPYVTYLYEKRRQELKSDQSIQIDGIKEILIHAREIHFKKQKIRSTSLSSYNLQIFLQYVRNLSLLENRLTPDLYKLVTAAKQIGGDSFAVSLIEAAREYPFQEKNNEFQTLSLGIDKADFGENKVVSMKNRLSETQYVWKNLDLRKEPNIKQKTKWRYKWNSQNQCSWPPEDAKIEKFNSHIREQSKALLSNDLARTEKFTTSIKDGVDIRETIRHWYEGDIYIKEIPPSLGEVEIVIFIFDKDANPKYYPWHQTWYAEHQNESTLCFYATSYLNKMMGPGIAQAEYGGCLMIYPPRIIPNIWNDSRLFYANTLDEKLIEAALFHSQCKNITIISPNIPNNKWKRLSRIYKKRIIHIPISRFSSQTIERIRRFHVLNGKKIRSFASNFIDEI